MEEYWKEVIEYTKDNGYYKETYVNTKERVQDKCNKRIGELWDGGFSITKVVIISPDGQEAIIDIDDSAEETLGTTNLDHYKDDIIALGSGEFAISKIDNKTYHCCEYECANCIFDGDCDGVALAKWFSSPYVEPSVVKKVIDWTKVPKDTLVRVWEKDDESSYLRYFSHFKDGKFWCYMDGATSRTAERNQLTGDSRILNWSNCELVDEPDEDWYIQENS